MDEIAVIDGRRVNLGVAARDFKYYIFDWDDNILHMPTRIYLEKRGEDGVWRPTSVSTGTATPARTCSLFFFSASDIFNLITFLAGPCRRRGSSCRRPCRT